MIKVAIVILNWNGKAYLEKFLPSVQKYSQNDDYQIIVADNGSSDNSIDFLKEHYPNISIIEMDKNYGFAGGYNKALQQIEAEYFVILNSDVEVTENWITPIIQHMDNNLDVAACQPKILSFHDKNYFEHAGAAGGFIDKFGYPFCRGRIFNQLEKDNGQYDQITDIFWATGACLFIRAKLFKELDGFDADFFAHMEEIDLCWRLKNRGYKIQYVPDVSIYHVGGGTLPNNSPHKIFLNFRNNLFLLYKNLPRREFWTIMLVRFVLDGIASIKFFVSFEIKQSFAVFRAHANFYKQLSKYRVKRKLLKKYNENQNHLEIYKNSIVFKFFFKGVKYFSEIKF